MARNVQDVALLVVLEILRTEGNALIEGYVVADDRCLTDNDTRAVVDGEVFSYLRSRMDVDTRLGVRQFCNNTRYHRHFQLVKLVGDAVVGHSLHYRITEYHLPIVQSRRVIVEHSLYVSIKQAFYLWQGVDKLQRQFLCHVIYTADGRYDPYLIPDGCTAVLTDIAVKGLGLHL